MTEETIQGNQTEESQESQEELKDELDEVYEAFGIERPATTQDEEQQEEGANAEETEGDPATKQEEATSQRGIKVKYNKEEVFVPEDELPNYVQKGMNYDKVTGRLSEYEQNLNRLARMAGFRDHADLLSNIDNLERQQQESKRLQYDQMRQELLQNLEYNGVDRNQAEQYLENHPLLQEAKRQIDEVNMVKQQIVLSKHQEELSNKWQSLYNKYPELNEEAKKFFDGENPSWYTQEMQARIERGYDPIDAYELAHQATILEKTKKKAEQKAIKQQQLGTRAQVEKSPETKDEPMLTEAHREAAIAFGIDPKSIVKHLKKDRR